MATRRRGSHRHTKKSKVSPLGTKGRKTLPNAVRPGGPSPDEIAAAESEAAANRGIAAFFPFGLFRQSSPLLPTGGATGGPVMAVIAVMAALACFALSGFSLITSAVDEWSEDLSAAMTIQVKGANTAEIEARSAIAAGILARTPEVVSFEVRSSEEAAKLLQPWLGSGAGDYLSVPALIEVEAPNSGELAPRLRQQLAAASPGLTLDDHGRWNTALSRAAVGGQVLTFGIFIVVFLAACLISSFAAQAGLAANADVVSLLHLVGATDDFIAEEARRRFFKVGLGGAIIGAFVAAASVMALVAGGNAVGADSYFLPGVSKAQGLLLPMAIVPPALCAAISFSAKRSVLSSLKKEF
ncbi:MAG: hypothetical protein AAF742_06555 [Pseudomonadota bacterium]